jgi:hypothetical protein
MYTITRDGDVRSGTFQVVSQESDGSTLSQIYTDDYSETSDTGVTLAVTQSGTVVSLIYSTSDTGFSGTLTYSINHLA